METIISEDTFLQSLSTYQKKVIIQLSLYTPKFTDWFVQNKSKIISKLKGTLGNEEDMLDIISELRCASLLLSISSVKHLNYEPLSLQVKAPDFEVITVSDGLIYVEAKRIRRTKIEQLRDDFIEEFWKLANNEIHRNFGITLYTHSINSEDQFNNLLKNISELIKYIDIQLSYIDEDISESIKLKMNDFDPDIEIEISCIPVDKRSNSRIRNYGGMTSTAFSGKEYRKFGDIMTEKIHQLVHNEKNIIFIHSDNETYESWDLFDSIKSLNELITEENEEFIKKKGFATWDDFIQKSKLISGIYLYTKSTEITFWNNQSCFKKISDEFINELESVKI